MWNKTLTCYILHTRPYRNTSILVELFSLEFGRIAALSKGGKLNRKAPPALYQPFALVEVDVVGHGELKTIKNICPVDSALSKLKRNIYCGMYLNELLYRLVHKNEALPELFFAYEECLAALNQAEDAEVALRTFEWVFIKNLGYGISLETDSMTGCPIETDCTYLFSYDSGLCKIENDKPTNRNALSYLFSGYELLGISRESYQDPVIKKAAKRLFRLLIQPHLNGRPLESAKLFSKYYKGGNTNA